MQRGQPEFRWMVIAEEFPASLVTDIAPEKLKDGQTPDAYGMGLERQGVLYRSGYTDVGSRCSTWNNESTPTNAPSGITTWRYKWNRLWGYVSTSQSMYYGAHGNYSNYLQQAAGRMLLDNETANIVGAQPFGNNLGIFKASNLYIVPNADNQTANFTAVMAGEQGTDDELKSIGMKGVLYFANANGVWAYDGQRLIELTQLIRENLGDVSGASITNLNADFDKSRIIGYDDDDDDDVKFVIIPESAQIFTYDSTDFRFTTKSISSGEGNPLLVDKIAINYEYEGTEHIDIKYQVKLNDTWKDEERFRAATQSEAGRIVLPTNNVLAVRRWSFRLTDIPTDFYIHSIEARVKMADAAGYAAQ